MVDFTKDDMSDEFEYEPDSGAEVVRQLSWSASGPAELELSVDVGRITVHLDEPPAEPDGEEGVESSAGEVRVEVRHDPSAGTAWTHGFSGIIDWLGGQAGGRWGGAPFGGEWLNQFAGGAGDVAAAAVRATEITWSEAGRRLVVRSPRELPLRMVPLAVTVTAPHRSRLSAHTGAGDVRVTGEAGWAAVRTGSGEASVQAVAGDADVVTGSGAIDVGPITGRARVRSGSGDIRLGGVGAHTEIKSGSGDVTVGEVAADLGVRTGSGDIMINDAKAGQLRLTAGSGALHIGVHPGVAAELDLSSGSGRTRSDLEVGLQAPSEPARLRISGRTGSGNVLVTRSTVSV
jgi:hypothetical protein